MNIKKWLSYFVPIKVYQKPSKFNKNLEITWNNGQLVLDSLHTNFSYGNLQKVLRHGLNNIGFNTIRSFQNVLLLGVAGGSVVKTLVNEIQFEGTIIGVEIDQDTIKLANHYFGLDTILNLTVYIEDAKVFVSNNTIAFDLIIIDIFEDNVMPEFLFETDFTNAIFQSLSQKGIVLFNTIVVTTNHEIRNDRYEKAAVLKYGQVKRLPNIEGHNELFILHKLK
jgi:spermidine synthase